MAEHPFPIKYGKVLRMRKKHGTEELNDCDGMDVRLIGRNCTL